METNKLTEKESLELIAEMIRSSKQSMEIGQGNVFLYWGYYTFALSLIVYLLVVATGNPACSFAWLLMFAVAPLIRYKQRHVKPRIVTYTDKVIRQVWQVLGWTFGLTFVLLVAVGCLYRQFHFILMLPLSLLYAGIGVSICGIILRERWMMYAPLFVFALAVYMLAALLCGLPADAVWNLAFGFSFVVMMVVPGHILNHKAERVCSVN